MDKPEQSQSPEHVHQGYGNCAVCGQDMPAGCEPHTYDDTEECHAECCPTCASEASAGVWTNEASLDLRNEALGRIILMRHAASQDLYPPS